MEGFFGLELPPNKVTASGVNPAHTLRISHIALPHDAAGKVTVYVVVDGASYALGTLDSSSHITQVPLDFVVGPMQPLSFVAKGKCPVHVTGYSQLAMDDGEDSDVPMMDDEEAGEEDAMEAPILKAAPTKAAAPKAAAPVKAAPKAPVAPVEEDEEEDEDDEEMEMDSDDLAAMEAMEDEEEDGDSALDAMEESGEEMEDDEEFEDDEDDEEMEMDSDDLAALEEMEDEEEDEDEEEPPRKQRVADRL